MSGLQISGVTADRAGIVVVRDVDLEVRPQEITVLLGANGAGKTTLLEALSGLIPHRSGSIVLDGTDIGRLSRLDRARRGLVHVEQGRAVFQGLTVRENLRAVSRSDDVLEDALALFPELEPRVDVAARSLSGGEQQMLAIARALACRPTLLMIDEMSLGLAPVIVHRLLEAIKRIADERGIGILLVEQFAALALGIGHRAYVLARGEVAHSGPCRTFLDHPELLQSTYLSAGADAAR